MLCDTIPRGRSWLASQLNSEGEARTAEAQGRSGKAHSDSSTSLEVMRVRPDWPKIWRMSARRETFKREPAFAALRRGRCGSVEAWIGEVGVGLEDEAGPVTAGDLGDGEKGAPVVGDAVVGGRGHRRGSVWGHRGSVWGHVSTYNIL